ncbi:MAG: hypothetical protein JWQ22_591 [Devosia sp.]|nr:hypothetical protein [Devosia sp.]
MPQGSRSLCRVCRGSFAAPGASTELTYASHPTSSPKTGSSHRDFNDHSSGLCVGLGRQPRYLPYYDYLTQSSMRVSERTGGEMRRSIVAGILACSFAAAAQAQKFTSPIDLVETLYSSYFSGLVIDDFDPYLSDELTNQMDGKVGVSEFQVLGFDPIIGDANWEPRNFKAELVEQDGNEARVHVSFISRALPISLTLTLTLEPLHGWQIEHIAGVAGDRTWCTNDILALKPLNY